MSKKSHHFLTLWPWPLTYDLEKLIRSGHYHYQCVYQIWEQSIPWFLSYRVKTIAGGGRLRRKTTTSPDPSDTGNIITDIFSQETTFQNIAYKMAFIRIQCVKCVIIDLGVFLTHWGRDKMAAIFQSTFWNAFSWMKMYEFCLRFHWSLLLRFELTIYQHWEVRSHWNPLRIYVWRYISIVQFITLVQIMA